MYKIICDRCGEEYGQNSEVYELEPQLYRVHRYVDGVDEYGDRKLRTICLCPKCESILDAWIGIGLPDSFKHADMRGKSYPTAADMFKDEDFGLPKRINNND